MYNNSTPTMIMARPSSQGDPPLFPSAYMSSPSKVTPASSRPQHRNTINLARLDPILYSHMTMRGTIQRLRVFPTHFLEPPHILLTCPLILGHLALFLRMPPQLH